MKNVKNVPLKQQSSNIYTEKEDKKLNAKKDKKDASKNEEKKNEAKKFLIPEESNDSDYKRSSLIIKSELAFNIDESKLTKDDIILKKNYDGKLKKLMKDHSDELKSMIEEEKEINNIIEQNYELAPINPQMIQSGYLI